MSVDNDKTPLVDKIYNYFYEKNRYLDEASSIAVGLTRIYFELKNKGDKLL